MSDLWIVIRNWDQFQHYKNRRPAWIKTYVELLDDPEYLRLTGVQRATLHGLWLAYAMSRTCLPLDLQMINRRLGLQVKMATLHSLNQAGFIEFSASEPLAPSYQAARAEVEEEKEEPPSVLPAVARDHRNGRTEGRTNEIEAQRLDPLKVLASVAPADDDIQWSIP